MKFPFLIQPLCLSVCLFGCFRNTREFLHSYGDIAIANEGLQILANVRHSLPLNREGSLACNTYRDIGHPFIMVISEDPAHYTHTNCRAFCSGAVSTRLKSVAA